MADARQGDAAESARNNHTSESVRESGDKFCGRARWLFAKTLSKKNFAGRQELMLQAPNDV